MNESTDWGRTNPGRGDGGASFVRKICDEEKLRPFDKTGIAAVVEYGVRMTGRQKKLSTRFQLIADLLKEANYWAMKDGSDVIKEKHVDMAIEKKVYRLNLVEEKIQEMIDDGTILIDSDGMVVGQVNGPLLSDSLNRSQRCLAGWEALRGLRAKHKSL